MQTRKLVLGSFLIVIALLLGGLFFQVTGIPISLRLDFAGALINLNFTNIPLALSGIMLGPMVGLVVGITYNQLAFMLFPSGTWHPIFYVSDMLAAFIPGLVFMIYKKWDIKKSIMSFVIGVIVFYGVAVLVLTTFFNQGNHVFQMISFEGGFSVTNMYLFLVFMLMMIALILTIFILNKKYHSSGYYTFEKVFLSVFLGIIARSFLNAVAIYTLFGASQGIPLIYYLAPRVIVAIILVPISTVIMMMLKPAVIKYIK